MKTEKVIWGLILIFIGAVFLLNNFNVIDFYWGSVWRFWPVVFILIGANMLFSRFNNSTGAILSVVITLVALVFIGYQGTRPNSHSERRSWFRFDHNDRDTVNDKASWTTSNTFTEAYSANVQKAELNIQA
jgi:membrane-bound ClpP family serine protease